MADLIGAGMALGGDLASSAANFFGQREQRSWEERMSNTAYQRSSADMKAAGLNPSMMFGSGGPATTPNVAAPRFDSPTAGAVEARYSAKRLENETNLADAEVQRKQAETAATLLGPDKIRAEIESLAASTKLSGATHDRTRAEIPNIESELRNIGAKFGNILADTDLKQATAKSVRADLPKKEAVSRTADAVDRLVNKPLKSLGDFLESDVPGASVIQPVLDFMFPHPDNAPIDKVGRWMKDQFRKPWGGDSGGKPVPRGPSSAKEAGRGRGGWR